MISRHALGRALALCDAAKLRLPTLEESLARGLASFYAGAGNIATNDSDVHSVVFNGLSCTSLMRRASLDGVTSLIQRRHSSSEEAFREYGRNFGGGSTPSGIADSPDDAYEEASYPEGLLEEEHMDDEEQHESKDERDMRQQLLQAALPYVKEHGWSVAALQAGASDLGFSKSASGMVSNGAAGLVEYFEDDCNQRLVESLEERAEELAALRTPQRVCLALRARLEMLIPFMDSWPQALAIQASPAQMGTMLKQRAELVDDIWHACGDTATDYNWYTKRGLLAGVYSATELFMITDYSPGYADTWKSLDRRLEDVKRIGSATTEARKYANGLLKNLGSLAEWAQDALVNAQRERQQRSRP